MTLTEQHLQELVDERHADYIAEEKKGNTMQTIRTFTASTNLGKTMPDSLAKTITVAEHSKHFHALDTCDVWTTDGYLVTAVQDDNITHHLRKGDQVIIATLPLDTVLQYNSTKKSKLFGF